jgi:hypothetical protein
LKLLAGLEDLSNFKFGMRRHVAALQLAAGRIGVAAATRRGRTHALQIARPTGVSNTRPPIFFGSFVGQMQQKSGQKFFNFFLGSANSIR